MSQPQFAVLGAGAWGLALADCFARNGLPVRVWDRNLDILARLRDTRTVNRPEGLIVHPTVQYVDSVEQCVTGANYIFNVVPSFAVRDICHTLKKIEWPENEQAVFVNCSKGIEQETLLLPGGVFKDVLGQQSTIRYAVLAGPSHAEEVTQDVPTAIIVAAAHPPDAEHLQKTISTSAFRAYTQADYIGAELGGALKNVLAIAVGVCDGKGYGDNTKAALITRGVAEIARLASAIGANPQTAAGLSGLGDLIVTALSRHSRNRGFGELIARGFSADAALKEIGAVVEGYMTSKSAHHLALKHQVEMPIVAAVYRVLYENFPIDECIGLILDREVKDEKLN